MPVVAFVALSKMQATQGASDINEYRCEDMAQDSSDGVHKFPSPNFETVLKYPGFLHSPYRRKPSRRLGTCRGLRRLSCVDIPDLDPFHLSCRAHRLLHPAVNGVYSYMNGDESPVGQD